MEFYDFPYIGSFIIPTDFHIFQRDWPPTSLCRSYIQICGYMDFFWMFYKSIKCCPNICRMIQSWWMIMKWSTMLGNDLQCWEMIYAWFSWMVYTGKSYYNVISGNPHVFLVCFTEWSCRNWRVVDVFVYVVKRVTEIWNRKPFQQKKGIGVISISSLLYIYILYYNKVKPVINHPIFTRHGLYNLVYLITFIIIAI